MTGEFLEDRKRAMEEEFFRTHEAALIARMRAEHARQTARQALREASGVTDEVALDRLIELGIGPDSVLALRLVPLVAVAWADGKLDEGERRAILQALDRGGLPAGGAAHALVERWLASPPPPAMVDTWSAYTSALVARLSAAERARLHAAVIGQARAVAEAAGGFLGVGKTSAAEDAMLEQLERAFSG